MSEHIRSRPRRPGELAQAMREYREAIALPMRELGYLYAISPTTYRVSIDGGAIIETTHELPPKLQPLEAALRQWIAKIQLEFFTPEEIERASSGHFSDPAAAGGEVGAELIGSGSFPLKKSRVRS